MSSVKVIKVNTKKEMNEFVSLPRKLYKGNTHYVPDLDDDVITFFTPGKNASLKYAEVQPFIALKDDDVVGRIAGIISHHSNKTWQKRIVRFTYIEFIDDYEVSAALIDAVAKWGKEFGMEEIQGPMGIHDFDKEGMLIEDFDQDGCFMEFWNPEYYRRHMEHLGFEKAADWLQIRFDVPETVPPRFQRVSEYSKEQFGLHVVKKTPKEIRESYGKKIFELLNEAFAPLYGFAPFEPDQADEILAQFLQVVDLDMVPFMEDKNGELVGVAVCCRDFSEGIRKSHGKMLPFGWAHILKAMKIDKPDKAELMIIGVKPEYQGMGVNAAMFTHLIEVFKQKGIRRCETNPQLDTNIRELSQWKPLNPKTVKRRRCWRKSLTP